MIKTVFLVSLIVFTSLSKADEKTFLSEINGGHYHEALLLWPTTLGRSLDDQALYAYALFKDKMEVIGFDRLQAINLDRLSPTVKSLWIKELPINSSFWRNAEIKWSKNLGKLFPERIHESLLAWQMTGLRSNKDFRTAHGLLQNLLGTDAGAWLKWQLALVYGVKGQNKLAVPYLQSLLDFQQGAVQKDEIFMAAARMLYEDNKLDIAMKYYNEVPKSSDFWLESIEEKAWIYTRLNQFAASLGEMKTALNESLIAETGPESYFLTTLDSLKLCDYTTLFKALKEFKTHNRIRVTELEKLAEHGQTEMSARATGRLEAGVKSWSELGPDVQNLPRFLNRDEILSRSIFKLKQAHQALTELKSLSTQSSFYSILIEEAQRDAEDSEILVHSRMKILARHDLDEMKKNLLKLQLAEAEAIHHMHVGQNVAKNVITAPPKVKDQIEFPYEENEVWLDELDHYQAESKGCPVETSARAQSPAKGQKL